MAPRGFCARGFLVMLAMMLMMLLGLAIVLMILWVMLLAAPGF